MEGLTTLAEKKAEEAEALHAFSGVKLSHIKQQLAILLGLIGRDGIFDEYTAHDISHIDAMVSMLDWLIPRTTREIMTPADWLLTVLAVYFHDLGMLVTRQEYEARNSSGFVEYRDKVLFSGESGPDYQAKVAELPPERAERFLYQEFVRDRHAVRVRAWVMGQAPADLGITHAVGAEVDALLKPLGDQFRRDLGLVCESHHLDDLYDFRKYKVSQPYGNSDAETANVQYAAILTRAADLLHITGDRTPSVAFRSINPADPVSQQEWAKQMAVKRVRPQIGLNKEKQPDEHATRDTIEVHAYFTRDDGFFGLTSYLLYAADQIRKCHEWGRIANVRGAKHEFPWRSIDDSNIETHGFLRETFRFSLDQARILDLLTGHTLYNDTSVVLRELVQNALDAIRLQQLVDQATGTAITQGKVVITWDSKLRTLCVQDNGTGMTQAIIENNLLKVGSSRYQDPEFRKQFPDFSAISRFGIGILSTFMIADSVEIVTSHPEDENARYLSLRSVHGKYLIRVLDKQTDEGARRLSPHGTLIKVTVRASASVGDVVETVRRWIVVPGCEVLAVVDGAEPVRIGFVSPRDAVIAFLDETKLARGTGLSGEDRRKVRVDERSRDGVTLAYAVEWSEYFREWSLLWVGSRIREEEKRPALGTCVEGVRVDFGTPGFVGHRVVAIANASGPKGPKTNVARSGLETTPELDDMLRTVYDMYCDHVKSEIRELHEKRAFSLTWAAQEAKYLLGPLLSQSGLETAAEPLNEKLLTESAKGVPALLVEREGTRRAISPRDLDRENYLWVVDCAFFESAEHLIREVPGSASLSGLIRGIEANIVPPGEPLVCGVGMRGGLVEALSFEAREVDTIRVSLEERRVDLRLVAKSSPPRWHELGKDLRSRFVEGQQRYASGWEYVPDVKVGVGEVAVSGLGDETGVKAFSTIFLLPGTPLASFLSTWLARAEQERSQRMNATVAGLFLVAAQLFEQISGRGVLSAKELRGYFRYASMPHEAFDEIVDVGAFLEVINNTIWRVFDPSAWRRRGNQDSM